MTNIIKIFKKVVFIILIAIVTSIAVFAGSGMIIGYFRSSKINVILITIDTLRADHLGCYNYQRNTSPNIDTLAKKGTLFAHAISVSSWTPPSMVGIATSNYPHIFGDFRKWAYSSDISLMPTLQGLLKKKGYTTIFLTSKPHIGFIRGFKKDFDIFNAHIEDGDDKITNYAINWLGKNKHRPFFLWIHYFGPHGKYEPPPPYNTLFLNDRFYKGDRHIPLGSHEDRGWHVIPPEISEKGITDVDYYISQYDGEIAFTDSQIGILFEEIKKLNLDKDILMVITSDHGESLGDHGHYFIHEANLYDHLVNVPLIIIGNGIIPKAKIIKEEISLLDLAPSILDILGINKPKEMVGSSLLSLIRWRKRNYTNYIFSERDYCDTNRGMKAVRTDEWKLIDRFAERDGYGLYNLRENPTESNDRAAVETEKLRFLKHKLDTWIQQTQMALPYTEPQPLDEQAKEELRSLGYAQ